MPTPVTAPTSLRDQLTDPTHYIGVLRRRWRLIALVTLVGLVTTWLVTPASADKSKQGSESSSAPSKE